MKEKNIGVYNFWHITSITEIKTKIKVIRIVPGQI